MMAQLCQTHQLERLGKPQDDGMFKGVRHNGCGDQPASGTLIRTGIFGVF